MTTRLFNCDLNWVYLEAGDTPPAAAHEWACVDPQEYYQWHRQFGCNAIFCQAYTFTGYAFYPTRLGPVAPGPGSELFPELYGRARAEGIPVWSYFCIGADLYQSNARPSWVIPKSRDAMPWGALAPESPWTELLCARIEEFLGSYPVDWLLFDWFIYGSLRPDDALVQPAWFVREPFERICGRPMPLSAEQITPEEHLEYKRQVLAEQFEAIFSTVRRCSPQTRIMFNVPYWKAEEAIWKDHPMLRKSDGLFAESSDEAIVNWLLSIKRPEQRVMTTIIGRKDGGCEICDPSSWRTWYERGCDFFGYAWGTPPDFRPHPSYAPELEIVRKAFEEIERGLSDRPGLKGY